MTGEIQCPECLAWHSGVHRTEEGDPVPYFVTVFCRECGQARRHPIPREQVSERDLANYARWEEIHVAAGRLPPR